MTEKTLPAGSLAGAVIAFDLDGTLVDTAPDLLRALDHVMDTEGLPRPPEQIVHALVGHGARPLIEGGGKHAGVVFPEAKTRALVERFIDYYRNHIADFSRPFVGAEKALDVLAAAGARLVVCTNKRTDLSVELLQALGLAKRFDAIVGADSVPRRKPHGDHFRAAIAAAGGDVKRALMVGDSPPDIASAHDSGAPAILVRFGYQAAQAIALQPEAIVDSFEDLPEAAQHLLNSSR